jgi:hypothetical protein
MPVYNIEMPELNTIDHLAAERDARYEALKQRLDWKAIKLEFCTRLNLAWMEAGNPLHELVCDLVDAPVEDHWDGDGFKRHLPTRTKLALADLLIDTLVDVQLEAGAADVAF